MSKLTFSSSKLSGSLEKEIKRLHEQACWQRQTTYKDPVTGYDVFTEFYLRERGNCCQGGCRHCPYRFNEEGEN